ncbi:MAG TPA: hypothetical protein PL101_09275 [Bacteroidales bacterium]|nr:hypothetical protein [Bacteroidales bacterium]
MIFIKRLVVFLFVSKNHYICIKTETEMNFHAFRQAFFEYGCINTHQLYVLQPEFNCNNLTRWVNQGLLVKLRNGFYAFREYLEKPGFSLFISNRIYKPSYISLHTALAFYGIIPEAVTQITAVSSLKTAVFKNDFGVYSYRNVREELFFGYELKPMEDRSILFAFPEKALLDLLYLYPFYNTEAEIENLRLDNDYLANDLNKTRFDEYACRYESKALIKRVNIMKKVYEL